MSPRWHSSNKPKFVCSQKDVHHGKRTATSYNPLCFIRHGGQVTILVLSFLTSLVKKWRAKNFDATKIQNKKSHFVA
jgi:hypothetical protein